MNDAHRQRAAELDRLGIKHVPCEVCNMPTEAGSKAPRCAGCWEVEHRIESYLRGGGSKARDFLVAALGEAARTIVIRVERLPPGEFKIAQCHCGPVWPLDAAGCFLEHQRFSRPGEPGYTSNKLHLLMTRCEASGEPVPEGSRVLEGSEEALELVGRVYPQEAIRG